MQRASCLAVRISVTFSTAVSATKWIKLDRPVDRNRDLLNTATNLRQDPCSSYSQSYIENSRRLAVPMIDPLSLSTSRRTSRQVLVLLHPTPVSHAARIGGRNDRGSHPDITAPAEEGDVALLNWAHAFAWRGRRIVWLRRERLLAADRCD